MAESQRTVQKVLACQEDLNFGEDAFTQTRGDGQFSVSKIRGFYPCNSQEELDNLDPLRFPKAVLVSSGELTFYQHDGSEYVELLQSGYVKFFEVDKVADFATISPEPGQTVKTKGYHSPNGVGAGEYLVWTLAGYRAEIGNPAWVPDEIGAAFTCANGNVVVLQAADGSVRTSQFGAGQLSNPVEAIQAAIDAFKTVDVDEDYTIQLTETFTPVSGAAYPFGVSVRTGTVLKSTLGKNITVSSSSGVAVHIPKDVEDVSIKGINFIGSGTSSNGVDELAFAIATAIDTSINTRSYKNISVTGCSFVGFNIDVDLRSVDGVVHQKNKHNGAIFSRANPAVAVAGYQLHCASCSNVEHSFNRHISGGADRHGFYCATAQSGVNEDIFSHHNVYEWGQTDFTFNPFMAAINLRPGNNVHVHDEIIKSPHGGGITSITDSGNNFNNLHIHDNTISNLTGADGSAVLLDAGAAISLRTSNGGYNFGKIHDNIITVAASSDDSKLVGISVSGTEIDVHDNEVKLSSVNQVGVQMILACSKVRVKDNQIVGNGLQTNPILIDGAAALTDCKVGHNEVSSFTGALVGSNGSFTNNGSILSAPYEVEITSDGAGGLTVVDKYGMVDTVSSVAAGVRVTFTADLLRPDTKRIFAQSRSASIFSTFTPGASAVTSDVGIRDLAGVSLPAASNAYTISLMYV